MIDLTADFPNLKPNSKQERTLKDNLRTFLKSQDTGTANPDGDSKPELQDISVMGRLKMESSDVYHTKVIQTKRQELIASAGSKRSQRKRPGRDEMENDSDEGSDSGDKEPRTKKDCLVRTALAIEDIANAMKGSQAQRDRFYGECSEKHGLFKEAHEFNIKRRKNGLMKEELEMLETKRRLGLINENQFETMAKKIFASK